MNTQEVVAHWADQTKTRARASNLSFEGRTLTSYYTDIAMLHDTSKGKVVLITHRDHSVTTRKHIGMIPWNLKKFRVPSIIGAHHVNLDHFKGKLAELVRSLEARRLKNTILHDRLVMDELKKQVEDYCETFDLDVPNEFQDIGLYLVDRLSERMKIKLVEARLAA